MDFFEIWKRKAEVKAEAEGRRWEFPLTVKQTIDVTIEALKEMIIKEPFLRLLKTDGERDTWIMNHDGSVMVHFWGVHGTDGDDVVVIVFRRE